MDDKTKSNRKMEAANRNILLQTMLLVTLKIVQPPDAVILRKIQETDVLNAIFCFKGGWKEVL